ncbi:11255_t:CDS:1 [Funneliformis geosporum]|uniref:2500_t:CDS:1 n=1 Tax=Funneliformis geosporum TaxID=1117311 RepID=A0A9W4SV08_9GLOM|nr:2500_t:CDS:1 [Funneliformis geosporum]CAI2181932.1 11255_t:CDS:1 [Funneliformis geosporum]
MPKSIKQKNNNRVINSNIDSKFNKKTNIGGDNFNYVLKPTFPSNLTINEIISVIKAPSNNQKAKTFPNAFIAYKKALIKENRIKNIKLPPMGKLSKIASYYWDEEPEIVKKFYKKLSEDAKSLHKQNGIQIIFDKRMNEVEESGQVSRVTSEISRSDCDYVNYTQDPDEYIINTQNSTSGYLPIGDYSASIHNSFLDNNTINSSQSSFNNGNFFEDTYRMNEVPIDQEDIRTPRVANHVNYTQDIEDTNFMPNTYLPLEDSSACNLFEEYEMEHNFNDFVLVDNNQESVQVSNLSARNGLHQL